MTKPLLPQRLPNGRFPKGVSGNRKGRPPKKSLTSQFEAIVDGNVAVKRNGKLGKAARKAASLNRYLATAIDRNAPTSKRMKAFGWLFETLGEHGFLQPALQHHNHTLVLPTTVPFELGLWMAGKFGWPPYTDEQIAEARARWLAEASAEEIEIARAIGYPDLFPAETSDA